jgi:hypothetical protein
MKTILYSLLLSAGISITACGGQKPATNECSSFLVSYATDVKPILDNNCASSCHSAAKHAAGIDFSSYEKVKSIAGESRFLGSIRHLAGFSAMPKKAAQLSDSSIKVVNCWIQNGMKE